MGRIERKVYHWLPSVTAALFVMQLVLIPLSWLLSALMPSRHIHSLISGEGMRWLCGHTVKELGNDGVVWLLLFGMGLGVLRQSRLLEVFKENTLQYRQRLALRLLTFEVIVFVIAVIALTLIPHAVLLSATGRLFPSSFSVGLVPLLFSVVFCCVVTYGWIVGSIQSLTALFQSLVNGISQVSAYVLLLMVTSLTWATFCYVLGI